MILLTAFCLGCCNELWLEVRQSLAETESSSEKMPEGDDGLLKN
jgi:hypothetical protein